MMGSFDSGGGGGDFYTHGSSNPMEWGILNQAGGGGGGDNEAADAAEEAYEDWEERMKEATATQERAITLGGQYGAPLSALSSQYTRPMFEQAIAGAADIGKMPALWSAVARDREALGGRMARMGMAQSGVADAARARLMRDWGQQIGQQQLRANVAQQAAYGDLARSMLGAGQAGYSMQVEPIQALAALQAGQGSQYQQQGQTYAQLAAQNAAGQGSGMGSMMGMLGSIVGGMYGGPMGASLGGTLGSSLGSSMGGGGTGTAQVGSSPGWSSYFGS
jgi:hypothetical protein